tara:strand:+ start:127 stop:525 length:399 start_codon:yes stop_codon:yes gene_type:complete
MDKDYIDYIREELKNCEEITPPFNIKPKQRIKYITHSKGKEQFFTGGQFVRLGNERIVLSKGNSQWSFPTKIRDDNNNVIYTSRIFIEHEDIDCDDKYSEYIETIKAQQLVIEKLTLKYNRLKDILEKNNIS